jgi:NitT/TauT family transport system substrate-binding protein
VQVAVERGDVDIGIGVPSFGLPLLAKGEWGSAINFYQYTYPYKWDIVVKPASAIKRYEDLKGKKIGVSDFAGTEYPVTRNVLKSMGIDPDADVKWVAVGNGVPAGVALDRGRSTLSPTTTPALGRSRPRGSPCSSFLVRSNCQWSEDNSLWPRR